MTLTDLFHQLLAGDIDAEEFCDTATEMGASDDWIADKLEEYGQEKGWLM